VKNDTETATKNACYIHESPGDFVVTYISIHSPAQYMLSGEVHEKCRQPWGVAWVTLHEPTENIFFSKLPHHERRMGLWMGLFLNQTTTVSNFFSSIWNQSGTLLVWLLAKKLTAW
jgi:hypothetical protein